MLARFRLSTPLWPHVIFCLSFLNLRCLHLPFLLFTRIFCTSSSLEIFLLVVLPSVFNISAEMSLYLKNFLLTILYKTADPTLSRSYFSVLLYFPPFYLSALEGSSPVTGRDIVLCALRGSLEAGRFGTSYDGETVAYSVFSLLRDLEFLCLCGKKGPEILHLQLQWTVEWRSSLD